MIRIQEFRNDLNDKKSRLNLLQEQCQLKEKKRDYLNHQMEINIKARYILAEVAKQTQSKISSYIEGLVTSAIQTVFDRNFKFLVKFEIKRNKPECQFLVQEGDQEPFVPKDEMGVGLLNIISFALRIVLWSIQKPRTRPIFLLDEPTPSMGNEDGMLEKTGNMFREVADKLGLQLIINTHNTELSNFADRAWTVKHNGTESFLEQIK